MKKLNKLIDNFCKALRKQGVSAPIDMIFYAHDYDALVKPLRETGYPCKTYFRMNDIKIIKGRNFR
jgi:hypothetical protein